MHVFIHTSVARRNQLGETSRAKPAPGETSGCRLTLAGLLAADRGAAGGLPATAGGASGRTAAAPLQPRPPLVRRCSGGPAAWVLQEGKKRTDTAAACEPRGEPAGAA
ncbi:unnamed protein product [Prorocentrum cordatum]|uniref:Uncharacterized protein n=1 Tax=Prorocentrum cordatum TaxID=2364126 RepID=A0ABN9Q917_9DINO|nr:unnamed protein product [Polarella glacialis]